MRITLAVAAALLSSASGARAQDPAASARDSAARRLPTGARRQVFSIQPLMAVAGVFSADYERAVRGPFTLGVGGSFWNSATLPLGDFFRADYTSAEVKGRFYPGGRPFHGFSIALTAGGARLAYDDVFDVDPTSRTIVAYGVKVGSEIDYSWVVGRKQRVVLALGAGGKRIFYQDPFAGTHAHFADSYPTSRIAIGYAF